jgi:hypothetical protein
VVFGFVEFEQQGHVLEAVVDMSDEFGLHIVHAFVGIVKPFVIEQYGCQRHD